MAASKQLHTPPASQRAPDVHPRRKSFAFHSLTVAVMINGFLAMRKVEIADFIMPQYGGLAQFLTIIGLFVSVSEMISGAASDLLPAVPILRALKRTFLLIGLPVELVISGIYWPLVLFFPHLMVPSAGGAHGAGEPSAEAPTGFFYIPLWMDLSMHALPAVSLLFDFFFLEKKYTAPITTIGAPILAAAFGGAYAVWVEHCAFINGVFPYPFLTVSSFAGRVAIYTGATLFALLVFRGLNHIHR